MDIAKSELQIYEDRLNSHGKQLQKAQDSLKAAKNNAEEKLRYEARGHGFDLSVWTSSSWSSGEVLMLCVLFCVINLQPPVVSFVWLVL